MTIVVFLIPKRNHSPLNRLLDSAADLSFSTTQSGSFAALGKGLRGFCLPSAGAMRDQRSQCIESVSDKPLPVYFAEGVNKLQDRMIRNIGAQLSAGAVSGIATLTPR
ncbi:MAG: hypothetical protein AB7G25_06405 [Sphingomonadaceae bacterium]